MIREEDGLFILETAQTQYLFMLRDSGHLEHLYYGQRYAAPSARAMTQKNAFLPPSAIAYSSACSNLNLENLCLEVSSLGKGDIREPFLAVTDADGSRTRDFLYAKHRILSGKPQKSDAGSAAGLPGSYGTAQDVQTLTVTLKDANSALVLFLHYHVYESCNVITRSAELVNAGTTAVRIERLLSTQLDIADGEYAVTSFCGAWAREMEKTVQPLAGAGARLVISTLAGVSSNRSNPFFMIHDPQATETSGHCFGLNLIYSGNHYSVIERNPYGKVRVLCGMNPQGFEWGLEPGECFISPEAVMTFSAAGFTGISQNMHGFVQRHIVRGPWQWKQRPVLFNSWEASYFDIHESQLIHLAKKAKSLGIELFVLDDGWFGQRNDAESSLGDWVENRKKIPSGIEGLAKKITALGLRFGIWVEPEMISINSDLYRMHPDWAVGIPGKEHAEGRNQRLLDMSNPLVQEHVLESMRRIFSLPGVGYVKWDMNRIFSDCYSPQLGPQAQGEFLHRYLLGLYRVLDTLVSAFPDILFEACASGGNRFDLGMLCYMPQIWASDNSDALSRLDIQKGYSYGYPLSVIGAHVSGAPNHQTLRRTPLRTRFQVACFGLLGYECNLLDLDSGQLEEIKEQTRLYREWREVFQFGCFYRIEHSRVKAWMVVSADRKRAVLGIFQALVRPNQPDLRIYGRGLSEDLHYRFYNIGQEQSIKDFGDLVNTRSPLHIRDGSLLQNIAANFYKLPGESESYCLSGGQIMKGGISLTQAFIGLGYNEDVRLFQDFAARSYYMEAVED